MTKFPKHDSRSKTVFFQKSPTESDLLVPLGYGEWGTSSTRAIKHPHQLEIKPEPVPIKMIAFFCYPVVLAGIGVGIWQQEWMPVVISVLGAIFVIPLMMFIMHAINHQIGTEPYVVVDHKRATLTLPREGHSFPISNIEKIVAVFFRQNEHYQFALLVREDGQYRYQHMFNGAGFGGDAPHKELAYVLDCELVFRKVRKADTKNQFARF